MTHEEAEQAVIGGLLLRPLDAVVFEVFGLLSADAFSIRQYREIYLEIKRQSLDGKNTDPFLVADALGEGYEALTVAATGLSWSAPSLKNYAEMVKRNHFLRGAEGMMCSALEGFNAARNADEKIAAIKQLQDDIQRLSFNDGVRAPVHIDELLAGMAEKLDSRMQGLEESRTILTGIEELDQLTGGFDLTDLILLAARPSMGKTEFALNLIDKITEQGSGALFFSMEMSGAQIAERQVAGAGGFSTSKLKSPTSLCDEDWARIGVGIKSMTGRPIWIDDASTLNVNQIAEAAERHAQEHPELAIVFVDYLGLIELSGNHRHDIAVGEVSRGLKALAKRIRRPVVALSQLSRGVEQRTNKRPVNADLKDSGSIEADADLIMMLYRDEVYDESSPARGLAEINVTKNRNGPLGTVYRQFKYGHFLPIDQAEAANRCRQQPEVPSRRYSKH